MKKWVIAFYFLAAQIMAVAQAVLQAEHPSNATLPYLKLQDALKGTLSKENTIVFNENSAKIESTDTLAYNFTITGFSKNKEYFLYAESSTLLKTLFVNGKTFFLTNSLNKYEAQWRLTGLLKEGANSISVVLESSTVLHSLILYNTPKLQISRYEVSQQPDAFFQASTLNIEGEVRNLDKKDYYKYSVEFALYDAKEKLVFSEKSPLFSFSKSKNKTKGIQYSKKLAGINFWSPLKPYLYTLVINMRDGDDNSELEILSTKIAFRQTVFNGNTIEHNGIKYAEHGIYMPESFLDTPNDSIKIYIQKWKRNQANTLIFPTYIPQNWEKAALENGFFTFVEKIDSAKEINHQKIYFPFAVSWADTTNTMLKISNRSFEFCESMPVMYWQWKNSGKTMQSGSVRLDVSSQESKEFKLPLKMLDEKPESYTLHYTIKTSNATPWWPKGHELGSSSLSVNIKPQ